MLWSEYFPNLALIGVALFCSFGLPGERSVAFAGWATIALDWLLYVMSWGPWSIHACLAQIGVPIRSTEIWPIVDAFAAAAIFTIAYDRIWGLALYACLLCQIACHILYQFEFLDFSVYSHWLDVLFWGQIAVFILGGGPHVWNRIADWARGVQLRVRSRAQASARTR